MAEKKGPPPAPVPLSPGDPGAAQVLDAAQRGDHSTLPTVRKWLTTAPTLFEGAGNISAIAEQKWTERIAGENLLMREALPAKLAELKESLSGGPATPLERLLVERVAACWLQLNYLEAKAALDRGGQSFKQAEFDLKRHDRAHRRYLSALRTLAEVRRLLLPAVQVNIGHKQVNVVGDK